MADERTTGLLTDAQRELIMGDREFDNPTNESKMWGRVVDRVYRGLRIDGAILSEMEPERRREVFRRWEEKYYKKVGSVKIPRKDEPVIPSRFEKGGFRSSLEGLLEFIYLGVGEGNLGDFEDMLESAIDHAVRDQGKHVKNFELNIEFGDLLTVGELLEMLEEGELAYTDLTIREITYLANNDLIDTAEIPTEELETIRDSLIIDVEVPDSLQSELDDL